MSLPYSVEESGCLVPLKSLGGMFSRGRGRKIDYGTVAATVTGAAALDTNLCRISAILENIDTVDIMVTFGSKTLAALTMKPGGSIQIDEYFPWVGPVIVSCAAGTANVAVIEVSIQQ
jgi:hypothetical protein